MDRLIKEANERRIREILSENKVEERPATKQSQPKTLLEVFKVKANKEKQ